MISAIITVERFDPKTEEYISTEVEVSGQTEKFGSANPFECGIHIADWSVDSPKGFELTPSEFLDAEAALERNI